MGLFGNETERRVESDPLVAVPQSRVAQSAGEPTGRNSGRTAATQHRTNFQTVDARAYLGPGSKITGKLKFDSPAEIEGQVEGEIQAKDGLLIGESAIVTAEIKASSIIVAGRLSGEVIASERIEVRPTARVSGNLTTPKLVVHEGAVFEGHCAMQPEGLSEDRKRQTLRKEERISAQANGQNQS